MKNIRQKHRGFLTIELVITVAVTAIAVTAIITLYSFIFRSESFERNKLSASLYAQEGLEAVEFVSRYDWTEMIDGTWHPEIVGSVWKLISNSEVLDSRFTRSVVIAPISRMYTSNGHAYGEIVVSGGTNDPETKLVTVTVTWNQGDLGQQTISYQTYSARDKALTWNQSDWSGGPGQEDFVNASKFSNMSNLDYSASGVLALAGNFISWDNATVSSEYDLPSNIDANTLYVKGNLLYEGTLNNSGNGPSGHEFYIFDISNRAAPQKLGSYNVASNISGIYVNGSYAALSTSDDSGELQIFNISNPANISLVRKINLPSNDDGNDIAVSGSQLVITVGAKVYTFDYSDPTNPAQQDFIDYVDAPLNTVSIKGKKAYIGSSINNKEFIVIDFTNPNDIQTIAAYDLPSARQATDIYAFGYYAYLVTNNSGTEPEFYMFRITDPYNPIIAGSYEVGENSYAVSALSNFAFVGSNLNGDDILVLDITNPSAITLRKGYEVKGTASEVYPTPEAIYIASTANDAELIIISVNSNTDLYPSSGFAESSTLDTLSATSTYTWLNWIGEVPSNTTVKFQIATNNDKSTWNYIGPDGTASTYYTSLNQMLLNYTAHLNQQYIRYKVYLESADRETTPYVFSIMINYSQ